MDVCQKDDSTPLASRGARASLDSGVVGGLHTETTQSSLTDHLISGLTSVILIVLGTVSLQFQGLFVPISLRPVFGIAAASATGTIWSSCS